MTFEEAKLAVVYFGEHQAKTLEQVAKSPRGMSYLAWMRRQQWIRPPLREALMVFTAEPSIARGVADAEAPKVKRQRIGRTYGEDARARDCGW